MKLLPFLFCLMVTACAAQPIVTNVRVDDVGHSSVRVTWDGNILPSNQRVQYGPTVNYLYTQYIYSSPSYTATNQQIIITGQAPGSNIHLCPQSMDSAGNWSSCTGLDKTITFLPMPSVHPVPATLPEQFIIAEPTGCLVLTASDLNGLQLAVNTAAQDQVNFCYTIKVAAGTILRGQLLIPPASDIDTVASSNSATNVVTIASVVNSYTNGMRVRVGTDSWVGNSGLPTGLLSGIDYCVLGSGKNIQLQYWPACNVTVSLGTAGYGPWEIAPYPPMHRNYIQIRTGSDVIAPDNVRTDPSWVSSMIDWGAAAPVLNASSLPIRFRGMSHNYYFGPGIHFTTPNSNQIDTTDPQSYMGWSAVNEYQTNIAFKRNVFSGGYPERVKLPFGFADGSYLDISDNYFQDISYWRPSKGGLVPSVVNGSTVSVSAGSYFTNIGTCAVATASNVTSPTGSGTVYLTLNPVTCKVVVSLSDWPRNAAGRYAQALIGTCSYVSGAFTGCINADDVNNYGFSVDATEGPQIVTACGPGPLRVANNWFESHSIIWHLDDSCSQFPTKYVADATFKRNVFSTPDKYRITNGPRYSNRNQWECKRCKRVLLEGNRFSGNFADVNTGPSVFINHNANQCPQPCVGSDASDFTATNNTIANASAGFQLGGNRPNANYLPTLGRRFTIKNNLVTGIDGWKYSAAGRPGSPGYCFQLSFGGEDEILDGNTCHSIGGQQSVFMLATAKFIEGLSILNNVFYFHEDQNFHGIGVDWGQGGTPNCFGLQGKLLLDCFATPKYVWSNNLVVNGYTNSQTLTGVATASAIASAYAGLPGTLFRGESVVPGRITALQSSVTGLGVDYNKLDDAQGIIKNTKVSGGVVSFHAPDAGAGCWVMYGLKNTSVSWARSAVDTSANQERAIPLVGLVSGSTYYYQIWCSGTAPTSTLMFVR